MVDPNKEENIAFRVSTGQKAAIYAHAESRGYVTADWLREKVLTALEVETMASGSVSMIPNKDMRDLVRPYVEECGCTISPGGTGHYRVAFPGVQRPVMVTGTGSGGRVIPNTRADLERAKKEWLALQPKNVISSAPAMALDGLEEGDKVTTWVQTLAKGRVWRPAIIETLEATRGYVVFTDNGAKSWVPRGQLYRPGTEPREEAHTETEADMAIFKNPDGQIKKPEPAAEQPSVPATTPETMDIMAQMKAAGMDPMQVWLALGGGIIRDKEAELAAAEASVAQAEADVATARALLANAEEALSAAQAKRAAVGDELHKLKSRVGG